MMIRDFIGENWLTDILFKLLADFQQASSSAEAY